MGEARGNQTCSQLHNGAVVSEEKSSSKQCSLHLWSKKALLKRNDLPKHLQFNPYIETGYRPLLSAWGCLMSLFYFHNETINIITHGKSSRTQNTRGWNEEHEVERGTRGGTVDRRGVEDRTVDRTWEGRRVK